MMNFLRVVAVFFTFIYCSCEIESLKSAKCNTCKPRNYLISNSTECTCARKQFCNETSGQCNNCGPCFNFWENVTNSTENNIETILKTLIKKYEINLEELQDLIKLVSDKTRQEKNGLNKSRDLRNKINENILNISTKIETLKKILKIIGDKLAALKLPENLEKTLQRLREIHDKIKQWLLTLSKIIIQNVNTKSLLELNKKINEMNNFLKMDTNVSLILKKDALSLALATEDNLNLLNETLIMKLSNITDEEFLNAVKTNIQWIESDLIYLIDTLYKYYPTSTNNSELLDNALKIKSSANSTRSKLNSLLKDQENFEQLYNKLKLEHGNYTHIKELQQKLNQISGNIRKLNDLLKRWEELEKLYQELNKYQREFKNFKKKTNNINKFKQRMDKLLDEETELLAKFKKLGNIKTVAELGKGINDMLKEIEQITCEIVNHCKKTEKRENICKV